MPRPSMFDWPERRKTWILPLGRWGLVSCAERVDVDMNSKQSRVMNGKRERNMIRPLVKGFYQVCLFPTELVV